MDTIKPIETVYKGYRFRSRLEARWAVFFDMLSIRYEYEKEGYDLGEAGWYLPDFWLPDEGCWVEIKGQEMDEASANKAAALACLHVERDYAPSAFVFDSGIFVPRFGDFPRAWEFNEAYGWIDGKRQSLGGRQSSRRVGRWVECPICHSVALISSYTGAADEDLFQCMECDVGKREDALPLGERMGFVWHKGLWDFEATRECSPWLHGMMDPMTGPSLIRAYHAAVGARFEHGEVGR